MIYRHVLVVSEPIGLGAQTGHGDETWKYAPKNKRNRYRGNYAPRQWRSTIAPIEIPRKKISCFTMGILSVCKQMYHEAWPILYSENTFGFAVDNTHLDNTCAHLDKDDPQFEELVRRNMVPGVLFINNVPLELIVRWKLLVVMPPCQNAAVTSVVQRISTFLSSRACIKSLDIDICSLSYDPEVRDRRVMDPLKILRNIWSASVVTRSESPYSGFKCVVKDVDAAKMEDLLRESTSIDS